MTFTQFINETADEDVAPSFIEIVRKDPMWPASSNRLEDFESVLLVRVEVEREEAIAELHQLWRIFAKSEPDGKHDLDLALSAWSDYARHLRICEGTRFAPCTVAQRLLAKASCESSFDDRSDPLRVESECDSDDEETTGEEAGGDPDVGELEVGEDGDGDNEDDEDATDLF